MRPRKKGEQHDLAIKAEAKALALRGWGYRRIAKTMELSEDTVKNWCTKWSAEVKLAKTKIMDDVAVAVADEIRSRQLKSLKRLLDNGKALDEKVAKALEGIDPKENFGALKLMQLASALDKSGALQSRLLFGEKGPTIKIGTLQIGAQPIRTAYKDPGIIEGEIVPPDDAEA